MVRQRRGKQAISLEDRLAGEAIKLREQAKTMQPARRATKFYVGLINAKRARK